MKYVIVIAILFLIIVLGCESNQRKQQLNAKLLEFHGKELKLPMFSGKDASKLKISSFINGECSACVNDLLKWKEWVAKDSMNVDFVFYFYASDQTTMRFIDSVFIKMDYPLIFDAEKEYLQYNKLLDENKMFQTFLLDQDNKVLIVGNPLHNEKLSELYHREIGKRKLY